MTKLIEFYFDFISPYSYIAHKRLKIINEDKKLAGIFSPNLQEWKLVDFEIYSAAQKKWLEISSVSTFNSFQSERLQLRYKDPNGKKHPVHTLNGSSLALPRVIAGLLENNQTPKGIHIPKALVPYTGFEKI